MHKLQQDSFVRSTFHKSTQTSVVAHMVTMTIGNPQGPSKNTYVLILIEGPSNNRWWLDFFIRPEFAI